MNRRGAALNQRGASLNQRGASLNQRGASLNQRGALLNRRGALLAGLGTVLSGGLAGCGASGVSLPQDGALAAPFPLAGPTSGPLRPLGGLVLSDSATGVAGLSALHLGPDLRITAVADDARWLTAQLVLQDGRPVALRDLHTGPLRDGSGAPLPFGFASDSESLARLPDGSWLVGFERWHRIRAYATLDSPGTYVEAPPGLEKAPLNGGLESLAVLPDGRWLAIAETLQPQPGVRQAWLGGPGRWMPFFYRPERHHNPSDAAPLPDGGALVLERRLSSFGQFSARLVRLPAAALRAVGPGSVIEGEELMRLEPPLPADNWEGVSAARVDGRLLVAIVSDDNGDELLERSMLLLFTLDEG